MRATVSVVPGKLTDTRRLKDPVPRDNALLAFNHRPHDSADAPWLPQAAGLNRAAAEYPYQGLLRTHMYSTQYADDERKPVMRAVAQKALRSASFPACVRNHPNAFHGSIGGGR